MDATLPVVSLPARLARIARGLGFLAPAAARTGPAAQAAAAVTRAAGRRGPTVLLVAAHEPAGARVAALAGPLARLGFAVETIGVACADALGAEALDAAIARALRAASAGRELAGAVVATPRALAVTASALGEALPRIVMLDPGAATSKCGGDARVPEARLHPRILLVHDLADADAAEHEAAALVRAWDGAELFMTFGLPAAVRADDAGFAGAIAEFLRRERSAPAASPAFPSRAARLRDGAEVLVRRLVATDVARKQAFLDALSPEARYNRFLAPRRLRPGEVARLASPRAGREFAIAATVGAPGRETIVGVARYAATQAPGVVELGVVVADAWQGKGLGEALLSAVVAQAARDGHECATGFVLATNLAMRGLARKAGFAVHAIADDAHLVAIRRKLASDTPHTPLAAAA